MDRRSSAVPLALLLLAYSVFAAGITVPASGQNLPAHAPGEVLVKFSSTSDATIASIVSQQGAIEVERIPRIGVRRLRGSRGQTAEELVQKLAKHPLVQFAEVNGAYSLAATPNDVQFPNQWAPHRINAPQAWDITIGSTSGLIAILDTGVDYNHPDLAGKVVFGPDYVNGDNDPMDDHGHGTRMAGIAGAVTNNVQGVAGLDWTGEILAIKVCSGQPWCYWSAAANGIIYAADHGARTISMSFGGTSGSSTLQNALSYAWSKGVVLACAAMNAGSNASVYPADYVECIKVGATDSSDNRASWSNWGSKLEVMAPGVNILTTTPGGGYTGSSGTSPATPHVAALASLLFAQNPGLSNIQVREIIKNTAFDLGEPGWDAYYGNGRIDMYAAVLQAGNSVPPPPPTTDSSPPTVSIGSPSSGAIVSGRVQISAQASDDVAVARVEFWVDTELIATLTAAPYAATWNTRPKKWSSGLHAIKAVAFDSSGKTAMAQTSVTLQK